MHLILNWDSKIRNQWTLLHVYDFQQFHQLSLFYDIISINSNVFFKKHKYSSPQLMHLQNPKAIVIFRLENSPMHLKLRSSNGSLLKMFMFLSPQSPTVQFVVDRCIRLLANTRPSFLTRLFWYNKTIKSIDLKYLGIGI